MENKDLISAFMSENKMEIQDNGFSARVLNNLPEAADKQWIVMFMAALGTSITFLVGYYGGLFNLIFNYLKELSPFVILGVVVAFPLVSLYVVLKKKNEFAGLV